MSDIDPSLHSKLMRLVAPSPHAPNFGFIVAFQGDSVRFRLVNGRIIYAHRRHVQPMRISVIMHSLEAARQYLINTAAMEIENADVLDMNAYLDHVNYLEFIRQITTPSNEPDETYAQYRSR